MNKTRVVCGARRFIGGHLVKRLNEEGYWIRARPANDSDRSSVAQVQYRRILTDTQCVGWADGLSWTRMLTSAELEKYGPYKSLLLQ